MKNNSSFIHSFRSLKPEYCFRQSELVDWVTEAHIRTQEIQGYPNSNLSRLKRFAVNEAYIKERYTEYGDASYNWEEHQIFSITKDTPSGTDIKKRNDFFSNVALKRIEEIYQNQSIGDHLIHVTCTGYTAPSAPQLYFANKNHVPNITHAYHMGCYASLPTIRLAQALSRAENKKVDIIHNEVCSIHLNAGNHSPEQIVVQTLFADGHIFYRVDHQEKGLKILGIKEKIFPRND